MKIIIFLAFLASVYCVCPTITPLVCTGLSLEGRSQCNVNSSCISGTCRGIDNVACSSNTHCYSGYYCNTGCACQAYGGAPTSQILSSARILGQPYIPGTPSSPGQSYIPPTPGNAQCPGGRMVPESRVVQCLSTFSSDNSYESPGLENEYCKDQPNSLYDLDRMTCSYKKGFKCVRGNCINQCNKVTRNFPQCGAGGNCGGIPMMCDAANRCYNVFELAAGMTCDSESDCPMGYTCNGCKCESFSAAPANKCQTWKQKDILDLLSSCVPRSAANSNPTYEEVCICNQIPSGCGDANYLLASLTLDAGIRNAIYNGMVSVGQSETSDCGILALIQEHCN